MAINPIPDTELLAQLLRDGSYAERCVGGRKVAVLTGSLVFSVGDIAKTHPSMSKLKSKKPAIFSFFAGAGFLDLGFEKSDYDVVFVNEYHDPFLDAYKHSRDRMGIPKPRFGYSLDDVTEFTKGKKKAELKQLVESEKKSGRLVGFIGGPPCPDFSVGGKNRGREGDNGKLSAIYAEIISTQKPDFFLFENVRGLWRTKKHR